MVPGIVVASRACLGALRLREGGLSPVGRVGISAEGPVRQAGLFRAASLVRDRTGAIPARAGSGEASWFLCPQERGHPRGGGDRTLTTPVQPESRSAGFRALRALSPRAFVDVAGTGPRVERANQKWGDESRMVGRTRPERCRQMCCTDEVTSPHVGGAGPAAAQVGPLRGTMGEDTVTCSSVTAQDRFELPLRKPVVSLLRMRPFLGPSPSDAPRRMSLMTGRSVAARAVRPQSRPLRQARRSVKAGIVLRSSVVTW